METLNASTLSVVLKIREGNGFGFLSNPFIIVCNLNGNALTSDPLPHSSNPTFESDFVWEAQKKVLRSMRSHNLSIRVECFSDAKRRRSDKIGYILLSMKHQAQIVSPSLGSNVSFNWHRLLGVRNDAKSYKPEIYLSLFIKESDSELQLPKTPPSDLLAATALDLPVEKEIMLSANIALTGPPSNNPIQVGSPRETDVQFKLSLEIISVKNFESFLTEESGELRLDFALFGYCFKSGNLVGYDGRSDTECMLVNIKSQVQPLVAYFNEFPLLPFLLQLSDKTVAKSPGIDMMNFITQDICYDLVNGKLPFAKHEHKLNLETPSTSDCSFTVSIRLEVDKKPPSQPIKPPAPSAINKKVDKNEDKVPGNKNLVRGISCKTKVNSNVPALVEPSEKQSNGKEIKDMQLNNKEKDLPSITTSEPDVKLNETKEAVNKIKNGFSNDNQDCNGTIEGSKGWTEQNNFKNMKEYQYFSKNQQCVPQFVYPYFQQTFPFIQDGRGDTGEFFNQRNSSLTDCVKMKITDEMAKKTMDELEEWKEKQKESYKAELKKKLDKEIKRLTEEWLSRQSILEREATTNIEESVSLSQQLHSTSNELKFRLDAVTKQQMDLEKERNELEKKYTDKHQELREASKKHQEDMKQQIVSLKSEVEELKAKICCLNKENEMLRSGSHLSGTDPLGISPRMYDKTTHLTDQQMTSLLVDMKSLEEKLSAALESKEFFRKEWTRALREIHRMKTEQEEQVKLQLQTQREELDKLRIMGLIVADEKASKDDLASIKDLRNQIIRLNTPKSND